MGEEHPGSESGNIPEERGNSPGSLRPPQDAETLPPDASQPGDPDAPSRPHRTIRSGIMLPSEDLPEDGLLGPGSEDRYGILGEIARGGMGAIVKIVDHDIRRPVAMKVILGDSPGSPEVEDNEKVERFVEEAQVTGQLEHPNIVPVHELGIDLEGKVYFTMKLVKGKSLETILDEIADKNPATVEAYPLSHLLQIFLKVCDAIAFAHSKGVIHRDLKPENVMVGRFGEVLVMDWGLSKVMGREDKAVEALVETIRSEKTVGKTLSGEVMGTPSYMPPEQASGRVERIDERSDIFALGATLYKILTHEAPYAGSHVTEVLKKAVQCTYKVPRVKSPWNRIPKALQAICLKAMSARKEDRYASVEGVAEDIRAYLDHRPVSAHRAGMLARFLRFVQRHPAGSLAGGVALILLSVGGALAGILLQRAEAERARAREKEAQADAESARAEAAAVRAQLAEEARAKAEVRATGAEDALKKGRLVSAVLRSGEVELGEVYKDLKASFYSPLTLAEKREVGDSLWSQVEAFGTHVPKDAASRAAWLALKGWFRFISGYREEAFEWFRESREIDGDVPYGALFPAMVHLSEYMELQPLPGIRLEGAVPEVEGLPPETAEMKSARRELEKFLGMAREAKVWGETSSRDFLDVLAGIRGMQRNDLEVAEAGLSKALHVPELVWVRGVIHLARAKVRLFSGEYDAGIEDAEKVAKDHPRRSSPPYFKGMLIYHKGIERAAGGGNPEPLLAEALRILGEVMKRDPMNPAVFNGAGLIYSSWGNYQVEMRGDAEPLLRKAIASFSHFLSLVPSALVGMRNRGNAYMILGNVLEGKGRDGREALEKAREELTIVLKQDPTYASARISRAQMFLYFGDALLNRSLDSREMFRMAIADAKQALTTLPNSTVTLNILGSAHLQYAKALEREGRIGDPEREEGIRVFRNALEIHPRNRSAAINLGTAFFELGTVEMQAGRDPRATFQKAINAYTQALRWHPRNGQALSNRANTYTSLGKAQSRWGGDAKASILRAIEDATEAVRILPESATAYLNRGGAILALAVYTWGIREDPRPICLKAIRDLEEARRRNPNLWEGAFTLGNAHAVFAAAQDAHGLDPSTHARKAIEAFTDGLRMMPGHPLALYSRGLAYIRLGESQEARGTDPLSSFQKAIEDLTVALQKNPAFLPALKNRGETHRRIGNLQASRGEDARPAYHAALRDFTKAMNMGPPDPRVRLAGASTNIGLAAACLRVAKGKSLTPKNIAELQADAIARLKKALELGWKDL
ncbi:MAG: protein kinase domain-containing protein, partial [Planctomycetota bacterium]